MLKRLTIKMKLWLLCDVQCPHCRQFAHVAPLRFLFWDVREQACLPCAVAECKVRRKVRRAIAGELKIRIQQVADEEMPWEPLPMDFP